MKPWLGLAVKGVGNQSAFGSAIRQEYSDIFWLTFFANEYCTSDMPTVTEQMKDADDKLFYNILRNQRHVLQYFLATTLTLQLFRPQRRSTYVHAACCYRPSSVVCRSVRHSSEPCKNG